MERAIITISENGKVSVPDKVQIRDFEIAALFEVLVPTVKGKIKQILKDGICQSDFANGGTVVGMSIIPDYYGLDMIMSLAFRIQSPKSELFRQWILQRMTAVQHPSPPVYIQLPQGVIPN